MRARWRESSPEAGGNEPVVGVADSPLAGVVFQIRFDIERR
jgi:hypothetical protein